MGSREEDEEGPEEVTSLLLFGEVGDEDERSEREGVGDEDEQYPIGKDNERGMKKRVRKERFKDSQRNCAVYCETR